SSSAPSARATGQLEVDVDVASGRDTGQGSFNRPRPAVPDVALDRRSGAGACGSTSARYMRSTRTPGPGGVGSDGEGSTPTPRRSRRSRTRTV
ncbi:hypothetical protein, partial [Streptomyces afghaniensis]|uniref:hypothetical protein n=1 Tax=Streptomyces afghaniensis TaxID=66865 RepID=UPI00246956A9